MIKKILLVVVLLLILGLVGYLLYNTFTLKSKQLQVEALPAVNVDQTAAAQRLGQAVQFQTVSTARGAETKAEPFQKLHEFLKNSFPKVHTQLSKETVADYSLLYTWRGSDASLKPIVLMAHQDVVPVDEATLNQWTQAPFSGAVADGFVWGRGTLDDKASLLGIMESVEMLLNENFQPKRTVYLAFGHDEEIGGKNGALAIANLLKERGIQAEFILDEGGSITDKVIKGVDKPVAVVGIAEKGYMSLQLTVEDAGGHSSQPPRNTAIGILSKAVTRLEDNPFPGGIKGITGEMFTRLAPEMNFGNRIFLANMWLFRPLVERQLAAVPSSNATMRTTNAATMFNSGVKDNILPNKATAVVNFRILPGETTETVTEYVRQTIADERVKIAPYDDNFWNPSAVSNTDSVGFQQIEKTIRQTYPETIVTPFLVLGATDSRHFQPVSSNIFRFSPIKLTPDDLPTIHGINERIGVENYAGSIGFYYNLIKNSN